MNRRPTARLAAPLFVLAFAAAAAATPPSGAKFPLDDVTPTPSTGAGQLAVRAVQGTPGGAPVADVDVHVQLVHRGAVVQAIDTRLDEHGVVVLEDLPVAMGVTPFVHVEHGGVSYRAAGTLMDASRPHQTVEVVCYETTDVAPDWSISMRHVMLGADTEGLQVREMLVVENPADRAWLGAPVGAAPRPATTWVALPPGAKDVHLGAGYQDWSSTTFADGRLVNHLPLLPKSTEMTFEYRVPAVGASVVLDIAAPAPTKHVAIMVPQGLDVTSNDGVSLGGTQQVGERTVRYYAADDVAPNRSVALMLTAIPASAAGTGGAAAAGGTGSTARLVAAIGGGLILLVGVVVVLRRGPRPATAG